MHLHREEAQAQAILATESHNHPTQDQDLGWLLCVPCVSAG